MDTNEVEPSTSAAEDKLSDEKVLIDKELELSEGKDEGKEDGSDAKGLAADAKGLDAAKGTDEQKDEKVEGKDVPSDEYGYAGEKDPNGMRHGQGKEFNGKGQLKYEGGWAEGIRSGEGKIYNRNGRVVYEGELKHGKRSGVGKEYDDSGGHLVYEGSFSENMRHGKSGKVYDEEGILRYKGSFFHGHKYGTGQSFCTNRKGTELTYVGLWSAVQGLIPDIILYHGEHNSDGHPHGNGAEYEHVAGRKVDEEDSKKHDLNPFKGEFRMGRVNYGQGDIVYEGEFKSGQRHGKGFEYPQGKRAYSLSGGTSALLVEGTWSNGNMLGRPPSRVKSLEEP